MQQKGPLMLGKKIVRRLKHETISREHLWRPVGLPRYTQQTPLVESVCLMDNKTLGEWYAPVLITPAMIGSLASSPACIREVITLLKRLEPDQYVEYLLGYYEAGLERFKNQWRYADITTALLSVSQLLQPQNYLEIGVRRGRSMAMVAATCPQCRIIGFDMWMEDYGNAQNPGPDFVKKELKKVGFQGKVQFVDGDSHRTVKEYLRSHPDEYYDLITVDGDHSLRGASLDLRDVLPRLKVGGAVIFDDIVQPHIEYLQNVWQRYVAGQMRFATWEYKDLGYGIAVGIRKY
ncbi:MAG: class I SAM-dependent methyltransferase [bacterium]|nr:class I SAM-dependent methyltransferase [bacterium]